MSLDYDYDNYEHDYEPEDCEPISVQCYYCNDWFFAEDSDASQKPGKPDCGACDRDEESYYHDDELIDGVGFADPGGNSALRAATRDNPRNLPCPTCERPNMLTPIDRQRGYQCDYCADLAERGGY